MKFRLKNKELQEKLDNLTDGRFSSWLNATAKEAFDDLSSYEDKDYSYGPSDDDLAEIEYHDEVLKDICLLIHMDVRDAVECYE